MFLAAAGFLPSLQRFGTSLTGSVLLLVASKALVVLLIIIGARLLVRVTEAFIVRLFRQSAAEKHIRLDERRAKTLSTLTSSIARYTIYFFAAVMALQHLGFNTTSILTAAGIGGLAIGFGAQNLVRDVITGFFILFEDQYGVGDYITASGVSGVVEEMGIRITKIRDFGGELHIIPNGQISQVTNHMGPSMRVLFDVSVSYDTDLDRAVAALDELFAAFAKANARVLVEGPSVLGVQELGESGITIRVVARTKPMEQWTVERQLKRQIKDRFDQLGIEIPFPHRLLLVKGSEGSKSPLATTGTPAGEDAAQ
ncbi:MAG: mechanosensitive ion channel family protein [Chitinophagales bacterium]